MRAKNLKTVFFAGLIAAMILPFGAMQAAEAKEDPMTDNGRQKVTDDPVTYDFFADLMNPGQHVKEKTGNDGKHAKMTNTVMGIGENRYLLHSEFVHDGEVINEQVVVLARNADGSINMKNDKQGFDVDFYKPDRTIETAFAEFVDSLIPYAFAGRVSFNDDVTTVVLYDSKYGSPGDMQLRDTHEYCGSDADFTGNVFASIIDVSWFAEEFISNWCVIPYNFSSGEVKGNGIKQHVGSSGDGYRSFDHSGGTTYYTVSAEFEYDRWP